MKVTRSHICKIAFMVRAAVNHSFNTETTRLNRLVKTDNKPHYQYAMALRNLFWEVAGIMKQNEKEEF